MKAASFVGYKGSGKTTLIGEVCKELKKKGYRVSVIKDMHEGPFLPEKDAERLSRFADLVIGLGNERTLVIEKGRKDLISVISDLDTDILLLEGFKRFKFFPRIILPGESIDGLLVGLELGSFGQELNSLKYFRSVEEVCLEIEERGFVLGGLDCKKCGYESCFHLARSILEGKAHPSECKMIGGDLSIKIDNTPISLNPFASSIIKNGIVGMISCLKGYREGRIKIELDLNKR